MKNKTAPLDNHPKISVKLMVPAAWPTQQHLCIEKGNFVFLLLFLLQATWWNTQLSLTSMLSRHLSHPRQGENCSIVWSLHNIFTYTDKLMTASVPMSFWYSSLHAKPMLWHPSEYCNASCGKMNHFLKYFSSICKLIFSGNSVFIYFAVSTAVIRSLLVNNT